MGGHKRGESSFGARLKALREAAGLSQARLAELAGMNVFGVAKLEQGAREPSWATVQALAKVLGVDCTAFAGCDDVADGRDKPAPEKGGKKPPAKPAGPKKGKSAK